MEERSKVISTWYQDLDKVSSEKFIAYLNNQYDNLALIKLKEIVKKKRMALEGTERSVEAYGNAAWPYKQAHNNGVRQTLKMVEDLLSFTKG